MMSHTYSRGFSCTPDITSTRRRCWPLPENLIRRQFALINHGFRKSSTGKHRHVDSIRYCWNSAESSECSDETRRLPVNRRRDVLVTPFLIIGGSCLLQTLVAKADEKGPESLSTAPTPKVEEKKEDVINSRIYDATVIGEPLAVGKDKWKIWEKLMNARIVYLGEAEQVPIRDDKELELEIVNNLRKRCVEMERPISLAMEAFPCNLQEQLNQYMDKRIDGETLKSYASHWPPERWQEYEPLLTYCRDNGVRLVACGTPLENVGGATETQTKQ